MLRLDKLTHKNQEALQKAFELATELSHQQIDHEHLSIAYLKEEGGIIVALLNRLNIDTQALHASLEKALAKKAVGARRQRPAAFVGGIKQDFIRRPEDCRVDEG